MLKMILLQEIKKIVENKMARNSLPAKVLQSKFKVGFPSHLQGDPTFLPFYFQLGKFIDVKNLLEFGFDLGMPSGCLMESCKTIEHFLAFRKSNTQYYTKRLAISNIHSIFKKKFDLWIGNETDPEFMKMVFLHKWNCVVICESGQEEKTYKAYLDLVWNQLDHGGIIVVDFLNDQPVKGAFEAFCELQSRKYVKINTLRGTGIIQK